MASLTLLSITREIDLSMNFMGVTTKVMESKDFNN